MEPEIRLHELLRSARSGDQTRGNAKAPCQKTAAGSRMATKQSDAGGIEKTEQKKEQMLDAALLLL